ncbi:MAG TPA: asparagine synthase-related protein [Anaerolineae bacterium]|nr:asparagine synthase-related protein [Anaerolineae bacterium]
MSALVGVYFRDGQPAPRDLIEGMLARVARHGARAQVWQAGTVALGQRSNSDLLTLTTDVSPTRLYIAADARLDNGAELGDALGISAECAARMSDAELIVRAYAAWEQECVNRLLGDFAFAVWDAERRRLFCARDRLGVKPFYFFANERAVAFASEIKALLTLPFVPRRLDEVRLADYVLPIFEDKTRTLFQGISRLAAAHTLTVDGDGIATRGYWMLDPQRERVLNSDAEYAEAFRAVFDKAVRVRLDGTGSVGAMLSGGLDSSAIVCTASDFQQRMGRRLQTFSAMYDSVPASDERPFIHAVLERNPVTPHCFDPGEVSPLTEWDAEASSDDEPLWNPQMAVHWMALQAAREAGVSSLLDGLGGDDVISHGVDYLTDLARAWRWLDFSREANQLAWRSGKSFQHVVKRFAAKPLVVEPFRRRWRAVRGQPVPIDPLLRPEYVARIHLRERLAEYDAEALAAETSSRWAHRFGITSGLTAFALEQIYRAAAHFQIEMRFPYFDTRLVEFCVSLPPPLKLREGWTRWIVREALRARLPEAIATRTSKGNLSHAFVHAMRADSQYWESWLDAHSSMLQEYVSLERAQAIRQNFNAQPNNADAFALWRVVIMGRWLERMRFV